MTTKTYTVFWTYVANFGRVVIEAASPEEAAKGVTFHFGDRFQAEGNVYVFEGRPVFGKGKDAEKILPEPPCASDCSCEACQVLRDLRDNDE